MVGLQVLVTVFLASRMGAKAIDLLKEDIGGVCVGVKAEQIIYSDIVETLANGKHLPNLELYQLNKEIHSKLRTSTENEKN